MTQQLRRRFGPAQLLPRYLIALIAAAAAGMISALVSARYFGPDGMQRTVPALLVAVAVALAVLAVAAFLIARRMAGETVERMARHLLWVVFALAALPGLAWFVLWLSGGRAQALFGLAAIVLGGLPLLVAARRPRALPATLGICAVLAAVPLMWWTRLFLLTPISVLVAGGWLLVLALLGYARRRRIETVVPSN
jgi:hypothetical protein